MEKKNAYKHPELDVIALAQIDIVTSSGIGDNGFDGETDSDW